MNTKKQKKIANNITKQIKKKVKNVAKALRPKKTINRRLASQVSMKDANVLKGTRDLVQNCFSGVGGIHRGLSLGSQLTALCRFKQSFQVTVPSGTYYSYAWAPAALFSQYAHQAAFSTNGLTLTTNPTDPWNSLALTNVGLLNQPGPFFGTNPSTSWRLVRGAMTISPTSSVLNQGGVQCHAYATNVYVGVPAAIDLQALPSNAVAGNAWNATNFVNFEQYKLMQGTTPMVLQWYPNDDEIYVQSLAFWQTVSTPYSGFVGYMQAPSTNSAQYTIELDYGIEYVPNLAYRPYVDRYLPTVDEDAFQELNKFVSKHWDECVVTTRVQYDKFVDKFEHSTPALRTHIDMTGDVGMPSDYLPPLATKSMIGKACDALANTTGYDVCDMVYSGANQYAGNAARKVLNTVLGRGAYGAITY